jgi:hypothetical protein
MQLTNSIYMLLNGYIAAHLNGNELSDKKPVLSLWFE